MKVRVSLYVAGQRFDEIVTALNFQEAKKVALSRNPNARIINVTGYYK